MTDARPALKYTRVAMGLHWTTVVLVASLFGLGWCMVELPQGPARSYYFALHKSLGLCVLVLLGLRVAWRLGHRPPPLPDSVPRWQAHLARGRRPLRRRHGPDRTRLRPRRSAPRGSRAHLTWS